MSPWNRIWGGITSHKHFILPVLTLACVGVASQFIHPLIVWGALALVVGGYLFFAKAAKPSAETVARTAAEIERELLEEEERSREASLSKKIKKLEKERAQLVATAKATGVKPSGSEKGADKTSGEGGDRRRRKEKEEREEEDDLAYMAAFVSGGKKGKVPKVPVPAPASAGGRHKAEAAAPAPAADTASAGPSSSGSKGARRRAQEEEDGWVRR